jgi:CRP/FNR family transcriptional regulator, nitrogen fixation regulation protein
MLDRVTAYSINKPEPRELNSFIGEKAFWTEFKYLKGTEIFGEAEAAKYVYQIISGAVRTFMLLRDGRRQIAAFHLPGDIFGIENGHVHRFTAEAIVDTKVWIAKRARIFDEISEETTPSNNEVLKLVARSLHHAENHLMLLGRQTALERVATFLTEMDQRQSPTVLNLPMTRRDVADYLGLTIETVSRAISALQNRGILSLQRGQQRREIVLQRRSKLVQLTADARGLQIERMLRDVGRLRARTSIKDRQKAV